MPTDASVAPSQRLESDQVTISRQTAQTVQTMLSDIRKLLDEFAPVWYTEEFSERLSAVLKMLDDEL